MILLNKQKRIKRLNDLLDLMVILNNSITNEIREVNRGKGRSATEIEKTLKYWIEDRIAFMKQEEENND